MNKTLTDICPMEKAVKNIDNPKEAYNLFCELKKQQETEKEQKE